ncbi:MAG: pyrophosphatase PpaX [Thermoanaerobacteraceae bacterium]
MNVDTILFDLDGTIIDTNELIIESFKYTIKKHLGYEIKTEDITLFFGEPLPTTLRRFSEENWELLLTTYRSFNEENHDKYTKIRSDVINTLEELNKKGIKMGIVTSKRRNLAKRGLELFNIEKYFSILIGLEDTVEHKPKAEPVLKALKMLKSEKQNALMVGDSPYDILSAKNAGVKSVAVRWSILPFDIIKEAEPTYIVDSMGQILRLL